MTTRSDISTSIVETIEGMSGDWEYSDPITHETRLLGDLAMKSLDLVVLSSSLVKRYGLIPFDELYTRLGEMPLEERDMTIAQFSDFVFENLPGSSNSHAAAGA